MNILYLIYSLQYILCIDLYKRELLGDIKIFIENVK